MNQLAHMALQHQGLCPTTDKKHDREDIGAEQRSHGARYENWEDAMGPRPNPHPADTAGIGMSYHWYYFMFFLHCWLVETFHQQFLMVLLCEHYGDPSQSEAVSRI